MQRLALAAALLLQHASAWLTVGANAWRTNAVTVTLPSDSAGALLEQRTPIGPSAAALLPPLVIPISTHSSSPITVLSDTACSVQFLDDSMRTFAGWSNCSLQDRLSFAPALDSSGQTLIVVTATGSVFGLDAREGTAGQQLWGPSSLPEAATATPLVTDTAAWLAGSVNGSIYRVDLTSGELVAAVVPQPCGAAAHDKIYAPLAQLTGANVASRTFVSVSSLGCTVAFFENGTVAWRASPPAGYGAASPVTLAPAVDTSAGQVYFISGDGYLCCVTTAGVNACNGWSQACTDVQPNESMVGGLAVSPINTAFHDGQIFALDATGVLYAAAAHSGSVVTSGTPICGATTAAPVVVPDGLDGIYNALLVVGQDGVLRAMYVGDAPTSDDDSSSDDDQQGNEGVAWSVATLPHAAVTPSPSPSAPAPSIDIPLHAARSVSRSRAASAVAAGTAARVREPSVVSMSAAAFAVRDDGRVLIPLSDGSLAVVGPQRAPPPAVPNKVIIAVTTSVALVLALATGLTLWFACRHRLRKNREMPVWAGGPPDGAAADAGVAVEGDHHVYLASGGGSGSGGGLSVDGVVYSHQEAPRGGSGHETIGYASGHGYAALPGGR
jgi:outer membrane protein assembly factor BamB